MLGEDLTVRFDYLFGRWTSMSRPGSGADHRCQQAAAGTEAASADHACAHQRFTRITSTFS